LDNVAVLDASALIALVRGERGADIVAARLPNAVISAVNQAEVQTKLVAAGVDELLAWWHISELRCASVPFNEEQARIAGGLIRITRTYVLSLGDRACLALAIQRRAAVYTTDRAWKDLDLGIEVNVIR
jgi:PIN domain nuclease of toxin-antitoxin system